MAFAFFCFQIEFLMIPIFLAAVFCFFNQLSFAFCFLNWVLGRVRVRLVLLSFVAVFHSSLLIFLAQIEPISGFAAADLSWLSYKFRFLEIKVKQAFY